MKAEARLSAEYRLRKYKRVLPTCFNKYHLSYDISS